MDECVCGKTHPWAVYDWDGGDAHVARGVAYYEYYKKWRLENAWPLFLPIAPSVDVSVPLTQVCPCTDDVVAGDHAPTGGVLDAPASVKGGVLHVREYLQFLLDFYRRRQVAMDDDRTYSADYIMTVNEEVESMAIDIGRVYALEEDALDVKASWEADITGSLSRLAKAEDMEARRRIPIDVYRRVFQYGDDWAKRRCAAGMVCDDDVSGTKATRSNGAAIYEMTQFMADYVRNERRLERKRAVDRARRERERAIRDAEDDAAEADDAAYRAAAEAVGEEYDSDDGVHGDDDDSKRVRKLARRLRSERTRRINARARDAVEQQRLARAAMLEVVPDEEVDALFVARPRNVRPPAPRVRFATAMDADAHARFAEKAAKFESTVADVSADTGQTDALFRMPVVRTPSFHDMFG
jgi:hypothetical protein